jgi:DNA-binding MarR family transcriptional regulator
MSDARGANLVGALVTALGDEMEAATGRAAGHVAASPAALVTVGSAPGQTIEQLRRILGLSHSGTVRLLDRLEAEGLLERRSGRDGRSVALWLTAAGRRHYHLVLEQRRKLLDEALELLTGTEQAQFIRLTEKLLAGLTRDRAHSDHICRLCDLSVCPGESCPVECAAQEAGA